MAEMFSVKALVDKESNKVIFIEADADLIDVLFSFLTIPAGMIVRQASSHSIPVDIGCFRNLYESVEKFDVRGFRSKACKDMLLVPYNAASFHFKNFKLEIGNYLPTRFFFCSRCSYLPWKLLSYYSDMDCPDCSDSFFPMSYWEEIGVSVDDAPDGCVFVKGRPTLIFTDDLKVIPPISGASISLLTKLGITDTETTEDLTFNIGVEEVMNLLMNSLVSKTPLTETLLKDKHIPLIDHLNSNQEISIDPHMLGDAMNVEARYIAVKLIVSKSKNMVCYAEAQEDFVDLLFSFLTLPLGFILEKIQINNGSWKGCADQLYRSVKDLDEKYLKSSYHKGLLVNPQLAPGFSYEDPLLGIKEAKIYNKEDKLEGTIMITTDKSKVYAEHASSILLDPKSRDDHNAKGFLKGPASFTVTDNLVVRPVSPIFQMSVLQDLKVPFTDIEDRIVYMGKEEALRLLMASFVGESALTNTFLTNLTELKQENNEDACRLACVKGKNL